MKYLSKYKENVIFFLQANEIAYSKMTFTSQNADDKIDVNADDFWDQVICAISFLFFMSYVFSRYCKWSVVVWFLLIRTVRLRDCSCV